MRGESFPGCFLLVNASPWLSRGPVLPIRPPSCLAGHHLSQITSATFSSVSPSASAVALSSAFRQQAPPASIINRHLFAPDPEFRSGPAGRTAGYVIPVGGSTSTRNATRPKSNSSSSPSIDQLLLLRSPKQDSKSTDVILNDWLLPKGPRHTHTHDTW